jgi:hypothetical protein
MKCRLGDPLRRDQLKRAHFKKAGFVTKLTNHTPILEKQFVARDCTVTCFGDEFVLYPCRDDYLDKDRKWKTSASLFYKNDRLYRIVIQVIDGHYAALNFVQSFQEACENNIGDPAQAEQRLLRWEDDSDFIACQLDRARYNASLDVMSKS